MPTRATIARMLRLPSWLALSAAAIALSAAALALSAAPQAWASPAGAHAQRRPARSGCLAAAILNRQRLPLQTRIERRTCALSATGFPADASLASHPSLTVTPASTTQLQLGFNTYTTSRTIAEQKELGASSSRLFVDWANVEPSRGQWNWRQTDQEYQALVAGGLKPLIVVFTAPCWARPSTDCSNPYFTGPPDRGYDQDWSSYVRQVAQRYPKALGIEVWNEPNLDQYFLPASNPARFTTLLAEAYKSVKAVNRSMPVISGGLLLTPPVSGTGVVPGGYAAPQFLAAMYLAGARQEMDGLGVHIYPSEYVGGAPASWDPAAMQQWLGELTPVRNAAGAGSQPVWITEMGISTATQAGWPAAATPAQQAADLTTMIDTARATANLPYVFIHTLEDQTVGYDDPNNAINAGWGLFSADGTPKPAACAVSREFRGALSC